MNITRTLTPFVVAAAFATPALGQSISIDGSSTVFPIMSKAGKVFHEQTGTDVAVNFSGTGSGFKKFARGETDISDASRPIKGKEAKDLYEAGIEYIEVPVAYDGLSIVVNKNNTWAKELTVDQLRKIFIAPGAQNWKQVDESFPNVAIKLYTPGEASGTYDYFVEVICGKKDKKTGEHKHGELRDDLSRSENDDTLVNGVAGNPGAIGFFGAAYYFANRDKINAAAIVNDQGNAVAPGAAAIEDGSYNPFSRPLFIYVNANSLKRSEVRDFIEFMFDEGPSIAEAVGYVSLPEAVYDAGLRKIENLETGSAYLDENGEKISGLVTDLYK